MESDDRRKPLKRVRPLLITAALLALGVALARRPIRPADELTGDKELARLLVENAPDGVNQLSAMVYRDGEVRFAGLGADEHTEVEIGSVQKTFTAELLRQAIAEGTVTAETRVGELLDVAGTEVADVPLEELAAHTSGLPRLAKSSPRAVLAALLGRNPYAWESAEVTLDSARAATLKSRGKFDYSNLGFEVLGLALASAENTTVTELTESRILKPLGMTKTYMMLTGAVPEDAPRGLLPNGRRAEPWEQPDGSAAGGLRSTSADMARYARHILEVGVAPTSWQHDKGAAWHNGGTYGYSTMFIVDPAKDTAVFLSVNSQARPEDLAWKLYSVA